MNCAKKCAIAFIATLLLQACTVAKYQVINKVSDAFPNKISEPCDIKYSLSLTSGSHFRTNTQGVRHYDADENVVRDLKSKYIEFTKKTLSSNGCTATYVENEEGEDIKVQVDRSVDSGDRVDALVSGLTLGLLPIWGTREGQFTFTFYNTKTKITHSYIVDEKYYIHLFFMPVFWAFTLDELKPYTESLIDFVENCNVECQPKKSYKIEPPLGKASLVLMRPMESLNALRDLSINVNELPAVELSTGNFTVVYVEPGKVVIENEGSFISWAKTERIIEVSENEIVFAVWAHHKDGSWQWEIVQRSGAESYLSRYTYIPPNMSDPGHR